MRLRDSFLNLLGAKDAHTNNVNEAQKTSNQLLRSGRDFLRYGNREQILPGWADVHMSDEDMYRGYSYAVIQKRGNKVASLAKENLRTFAKPEVVDAFQKEEETVEHPYLKMIRNSSKFTEKQFWKNISIYLDLAGRYYLGVVRREIKPLKDDLPIITTDIQEFILLNPYEIRRVVDKDHELAGYIERKKDGRYREWPKYQIIEMRELNPFNSDDGQWAMTDAAKEAVFTLNQSGDYTRQSISGNIDAPGIITTDVILEDEDFENFKSRIAQHRRGEPLFGNGPGAIKWDSMQVDLDKAALLDINEINRTTLFAVSGTSKTSLGIEQSGTTRETARVQSEQFVSDTAQPRLEDIVDFLNLDYKRHYAQEFDKTGYSIYVQSAVGKDYDSETKATQLRQVQIELAMSLMQSGYTKESAYQYAQGDIGLSDLELEDGLDKPKTEDDNPEGEEGNTPQTPPEAPQGGSNGGNGSSRGSENESDSGTNNGLDLDLEPHGDLVENSKDGGNPNHESVESPKGGQSKIIKKDSEDFGESVSEEIDTSLTEPKKDNSVHIHQDNVVCPDCENKLEDLRNENKELDKLYQGFLKEISALELEMVEKASRRVTVNAFSEEDIVGPRQKKNYLDKLKKLLSGYWGKLFVLFGKDTVEQRNREFNTNQVFTLDNSMTERIDDNANRVADGHYQTIVNDILGVANRAYTAVAEGIAADLIVEAYKVNPDKFADYFDSEPSRADALKSIQKTDILEENKRIYEKANKMAYDGYKRADIVKAIRESYPDIKENRATLIAGNETARAYGRSQYEADLQFLKNTGMIGKAYKRLVSSRPEGDRDKICPFCASLIEKTKNSPIPFTEPFLKFGDSIEVIENGAVKNFTANYESIDASTIHPNCYARDTQVYTNEGWKRVDELTGKELFWSIDPETKKPEWVKAKAKIQGYADKLLRLHNKNFDMATTFDHNMFVEKKHKDHGRYYRTAELVEAQNLARADRFYAGVEWVGEEPDTIKLGDYDVPAELYCKFMGYYISEGCANVYNSSGRKNGKKWQASIGQETYHDEFWRDLQKMPFRVWNGKKIFTFSDKSVVEYCMQLGKSHEKFIPSEIKQLSPRLLNIFLDAFVLGDGNRKYSSYSNAWMTTVSTSSVKLRDDLTEVIQKSGYRPTVKLMSPKGTLYRGTNYRTNHDVWQISICNRVHAYKGYLKEETIDYYDDVFCVELEKNHTLWVMYNGKCWWSGNCFCRYELIIKENNANGNKVSNVVISTDDYNNIVDNSDDGIGKKVENFNDKHEPAGSPKGGQATSDT